MLCKDVTFWNVFDRIGSNYHAKLFERIKSCVEEKHNYFQRKVNGVNNSCAALEKWKNQKYSKNVSIKSWAKPTKAIKEG